MAALEAPTVIFFVDGDEPDPGLGIDGTIRAQIQRPVHGSSGTRSWARGSCKARPVGIQWLGAWSAATEYTANTAVSRLGSSYVSRTININRPPESNPIDWDLSTARGTDGLDGVDGEDGNCGGISLRYVFDGTSQADSDPGDGKLRLGQVVQSTATAIRADLLDAGGVNVAALLDQLDASTSSVKAQVRLMKEFDPSRFIDFNLTGCARWISQSPVSDLGERRKPIRGWGHRLARRRPGRRQGRDRRCRPHGRDRPQGETPAVQWTFSAEVGDFDPGNGNLRIDHTIYGFAGTSMSMISTGMARRRRPC